MSRRRSGPPQMTGDGVSEDRVINVVNEAITTYDKETALPRHEQNLEKFDKLFGVMNKVKGALVFAGFALGLPSLCMTVILIIKAIRGH